MVVEDVPDDEDEDLQEPISLLRNQTPPDGEWMEPIPTQSKTTAAVPTINENSCSVHGTKVLQQYSPKRTNKNRNRKRIQKMIRYTEQCSDLSNEQRERELEKLQCEMGRVSKEESSWNPLLYTESINSQIERLFWTQRLVSDMKFESRIQ